jgi:hypothetical protein
VTSAPRTPTGSNFPLRCLFNILWNLPNKAKSRNTRRPHPQRNYCVASVTPSPNMAANVKEQSPIRTMSRAIHVCDKSSKWSAEGRHGCRVFDIWCHNIESMAYNLCESIAILKSLGTVVEWWVRIEFAVAGGIRVSAGHWHPESVMTTVSLRELISARKFQFRRIEQV